MDQNGPEKLAACRQLFPKGDEDLNSLKIQEELRKDQEEFKEKYNYDPIEDTPIPGKFEYTFDEEKGYLIGRPKDECNNSRIDLVDTNETDDNHKDSNKTPKIEENQIRNNMIDGEASKHDVAISNT